MLRVFSNDYGGSWLPLFSASKARKAEDENYWVVGLNASKLFCIVCKSPETYPSVTPKPVLTLLDLSFPLPSSDLGAGDLENEFIMSNLQLSRTQMKIKERAGAGLDTTALEDEAFNTETAIDRCILRLIATCCNSDKLVRATELARLLTLEKSLKGAIKLVTALKLPLLAERFNGILEERLSDECETTASPNVISKCTNTQPLKSLPSTEIRRTAESPSSLSHCISKHEKLEEKSKIGVTGACSNMKEGAAKAGFDQGKAQMSSNPFSKASGSQEKPKGKAMESSEATSEKNSKEQVNHISSKIASEGVSSIGINEKQGSRPANPFAKSGSNQDKSSLIDSIKKMRKAEHEKNEKVGGKKTKR